MQQMSNQITSLPQTNFRSTTQIEDAASWHLCLCQNSETEQWETEVISDLSRLRFSLTSLKYEETHSVYSDLSFHPDTPLLSLTAQFCLKKPTWNLVTCYVIHGREICVLQEKSTQGNQVTLTLNYSKEVSVYLTVKSATGQRWQELITEVYVNSVLSQEYNHCIFGGRKHQDQVWTDLWTLQFCEW